MASLRTRLTQLIANTLLELDMDAQFGQVRWSDRPDLGQFQCNGPLAAAKRYNRPSREVAESVVAQLHHPEVFKEISLAGPGFINFVLTDAYLTEHLRTFSADDRFGLDAQAAKTYVIDYGGPNIAKPMHVGHLRSAVIGECLKRVARYMGHTVWGDVHLGDWGLQMGMIIAEIQFLQPDLPFFQENFAGQVTVSPVSIEDLEKIYPAAKAHCEKDAAFLERARAATKALQQGHAGYRALWQHFIDVSIAVLKEDYAHLDVSFDLWLGESHAQNRIPSMIDQLRAQGFAQESEGAWVIPVEDAKDKKPLPPLILIKSDGAVLYATTDLATIQQRMDTYHPNGILYVVDNRQEDHFRQVFRAAYKTAIAPPELTLEHIGFGTMNGKDGKPFKTREGGVMKLKDLLTMITEKAKEKMRELGVAKDYPPDEQDAVAEKVGVAALKFADMINHRTKNYIFDLDRFVSFEGKTGPYIQYSLVRGLSILRKATEQNLLPGVLPVPQSEEERNVMLKIAQFPDVLELTFEQRAPNHLCEYAYMFAMDFNRFYHQCPVLKEPDSEKRAGLLALTARCTDLLQQALQLLAIPVPERM